MRSQAFLDFVRDRVLADIAARPSIRPYLTEIYAEPKRTPGPKPKPKPEKPKRQTVTPEVLEARRQHRLAWARAWQRAKYAARKGGASLDTHGAHHE
jgi:hypothetical protein